MYAQVEKPKENKSRSVANSVGQKKNNMKQGLGFVDNRPEAMLQRKLQERINRNSQTVSSLPVNEVIQRDACYIPDQNSPYVGIGKVGNVGPGEGFDHNQRFAILAANYTGAGREIIFDAEAHLQRDDITGIGLIDAGSVTQETAAVDHIVPKDLGGGNTELNAQVISTSSNSAKGNTYPWGPYSGFRVYDPASGNIYPSRAVAAASGVADMTTLNARGW